MDIRVSRYNAQRGRCFYCCNPIWERMIEPRPIANFRLGNKRSEMGNIHETFRTFQSTAEHLVPLSMGGSDSPENIVAACEWCNSNRKNLPVDEWKAHVSGLQFVNSHGKRLTNVICLEIGLEEVERFCQSNPVVAASSYHLANSIAVIFPNFSSKANRVVDFQDAYNFRQTLHGTRAAFEHVNQLVEIQKQFGSKVFR